MKSGEELLQLDYWITKYGALGDRKVLGDVRFISDILFILNGPVRRRR